MSRNLLLFPEIAYGDDYQYLHKEGLKLINKLIEQYDIYDGKFWKDAKGKELTPADLKARNGLDYEPTMLTVNLVAWMVDRIAAFLFEKPISVAGEIKQVDKVNKINEPDYKPSEAQLKEIEKAAAREKLIYKTFKQNLMDEKLLKAATDHLIGSGVCCKLHYDANRGLRYVWRPRLEYWPVYNADDIDVLEKITFAAFIDDETIWAQKYWMNDDGTAWMQEAHFDTSLKVKEWIVEPKSTELPFIPVEIFPRAALTGETDGRSLVDTLASINQEINRKLSDNADSLRFGMFAIKVLLNAVLPTEDEIAENPKLRMNIAPNALWQVISGDPEINADVKMIENKFGYIEALKQHLETLMSMMYQLANIPNLSPDQIKGFGQLSGFALQILYGPLISVTHKNLITWAPRLQRLFGKALYMINHYENSNHYGAEDLKAAALSEVTTANLEEVVKVIHHMPIPKNEAEEVDKQVKLVASMLNSLKNAMDQLGVENPERLFAEMLAEKKTINQILTDALGEVKPMDGGKDGGSGEGGTE